MRTLIRVIIRFHFLLLFIVFEVLSLTMVISTDVKKKKIFLSSANAVSGALNKRVSSFESYFNLDEQNQKLKEQNANLLIYIERLKSIAKISVFDVDTASEYNYEYLNAEVIKNTVSMSRNFITLDKGEKDGVEVDFAVLGLEGVVGVVVATSKHYSLVVSVLNDCIGISAKIKKNNFFGTLKWDGRDYRYCKLSGIPGHLSISIGDTIVTSGYSAIFPRDINIGIVSKVEKEESNNFYDIDVRLFTDMKSVRDVYIVNNRNKREQILLENIAKDEY